MRAARRVRLAKWFTLKAEINSDQSCSSKGTLDFYFTYPSKLHRFSYEAFLMLICPMRNVLQTVISHLASEFYLTKLPCFCDYCGGVQMTNIVFIQPEGCKLESLTACYLSHLTVFSKPRNISWNAAHCRFINKESKKPNKTTENDQSLIIPCYTLWHESNQYLPKRKH